MNNPLLELFGFSIHIIIIAFFLQNILSKKYAISSLLLLLIALISRYFRLAWPDNLFTGATVETVLFFVSVLLLYQSKLAKKVFTFCLILLALIISDLLAYFTLHALYGYELADLTSLLFPNFMSVILMNIVFLLVILLFLNVWNIATRKIEQNQMSLFMFFPVSQIYLLLILFLLATYYNNFSLLIIFIISLVFCFLANIGLVIAMRKLTHLTLLREKLAYLKEHLHIQLNHYQQLSKYNLTIQKYKHDMKNQLQTIYGLLNNQEFQTAQTFTDQLAAEIDLSVPTPFCANPVIDALLQNKYSVAQKKGIKMKLGIHLNPAIDIEDFDLCSIFANLLDNALEACSQITDPAISPSITVNCYPKKDLLIITVTNTKQNNIIFTPNRKILSGKKDVNKHGLGLTIVTDIAQKHHGELQLSHNDQEFKATVVLGLKTYSFKSTSIISAKTGHLTFNKK